MLGAPKSAKKLHNDILAMDAQLAEFHVGLEINIRTLPSRKELRASLPT